jgi:hypothetical protein
MSSPASESILRRYWLVGVASLLVVLGVAGSYFLLEGPSTIAISVEDEVDFRLPNGQVFTLKLEGEPFTGHNVVSKIAFSTEGKQPLEDVLYYNRDDWSRVELVALGDPAVLGDHPGPWLDGPPGPEARRISAQSGRIVLSHAQVVFTVPVTVFDGPPSAAWRRYHPPAGVDETNPLTAPGLTYGPNKILVSCPYPVAGVRHTVQTPKTIGQVIGLLH